jgi:peptide deformylase
MSETIVFNTEDTLKGVDYVRNESIPKFSLVAEDHPILREILPDFDFDNPLVNPNEFASSLVETCKENKGLGLSANQCGFKHRVFVMGHGDDYVAFFNPRITEKYDECHMLEGCLSFPLLGLRISRPSAIDVEYQDFHGKVHQAHFTGISARCFQHELDHMNGILYTDRVKPLALQTGMQKRNKMMRKLRIK